MIFITKTGKEIQVPNDYTYMSMEKFATEIYKQGITDAFDVAIEQLKPRLKWDNDIYTLAISHCIQVLEYLKEQKNE